MGKEFDVIDNGLADWIAEQHLFFVSTAPLDPEGLINCSPKGLDSFRILEPRTVAYGDLNGSGIETAAHLQENGRITIMFCALAGAPRIVRLYGRGSYHAAGTESFDREVESFAISGLRGIVRVELTRIADSCGYGVPRYDYVGDRDTLSRWCDSKSPEEMAAYQAEKNRFSLDGLPGLRS